MPGASRRDFDAAPIYRREAPPKKKGLLAFKEIERRRQKRVGNNKSDVVKVVFRGQSLVIRILVEIFFFVEKDFSPFRILATFRT